MAANGLVLGAEQPNLGILYFGHIAAVDEGMANRDMAGHFLKQRVQVLARRNAGQKPRIKLFGPRNVEAVDLGIIEKVTLDPPCFGIYLLPFGLWIDPDPHGVESDDALALLHRLAGVGDDHLLALHHQHFRAVARECEGSGLDLVDQLLVLAAFEIKAEKRLRRAAFLFQHVGIGRNIRCGQGVDDALPARLQAYDIGARNRQREDALIDLVEVDAHERRRRRGGTGALLNLAGGGRLGRLVGFLLLLRRDRPGLGLVRCTFLVALRRDRGRRVLAEDHYIGGTVYRAAQARHVQPAGAAADAGRCSEIKIFAAVIEARGRNIAKAVGDLHRLACFDAIDKGRMKVIGQLLGIGNPAAVGGPRLAEDMRW